MASAKVIYKGATVGEMILGRGVQIYNQNDQEARDLLKLVETTFGMDNREFAKRVQAQVESGATEVVVDSWFTEPFLEETPEHDPVNHPKHYTSHPSGVECIEITRHMSFNLGNAVKYIWRDGLKDTEVPIQDLKKALWYLQDEIALREKSL